MSEKQLRALALHNFKKKNTKISDEIKENQKISIKKPECKLSTEDISENYPEIIFGENHKKLQPPTAINRSAARGIRLVKSDPVESTSGFDTQISIQNEEDSEEIQKTKMKRSYSFNCEILLKYEKIEDPMRRNSCILDYQLKPIVETQTQKKIIKAIHNKSMSDNTADVSFSSAIPKNYRYSIKDFQFVKAVNSGSFGKICLVKMINTGELYAMKIIDSEEVVANNRESYVESEWNVFRQANSEYIVRCYYTFYYSKYLCFVMEYLNGGDLSFFLQEYALYEKEAKIYLAELILALEYLHSKGIIHKDVKPANILIGSDGHIKLSDFGLSMCTYKKSSHLEFSYHSPLLPPKVPISEISNKNSKKVGTVYYMAPEVILNNEVTPDADWWAVGVIAYEMLTGQYPFTGDTTDEIFENILKGNPNSFDTKDISENAQDLINKLLCLNREKCLGHNGAYEIKQHAFFKGINWKTIRNEKPPFVPINKPENPTLYFPKEKEFSLEKYIQMKDTPNKTINNEQENKLRIEANLMFQRFTRSNSRPIASKNISSAINVLAALGNKLPTRKSTFK